MTADLTVSMTPDPNATGPDPNVFARHRRPKNDWPAPVGVLLTLALALLAGCSQDEGIVTYKIPTKVPEVLLPGKDRMLAVMIPRGDKVWFFKVLGPKDAVDLIDASFRSFVSNIQFDERGEPLLSPLPEGWRRGGVKPMRFATIDINTKRKQLDLSISNLAAPAGLEDAGWDSYVVQNVDRWRGQVGLKPSSEKWSGGQKIDIAAADGPAVWVDLIGQTGTASPSMGSRMPPMMTGTGPRSPPATTGPASTGPASSVSDASGVEFESPDGWREQPARGMREAAFQLGDEDAGAEVTIITAGGDLRNNVARWMGQVSGGSPDDAAVEKMLADAEKFDVSGRPAQRFIIPGDAEQGQQSIDATIVEMEGGRSKFIKMTGDPKTVSEASESMKAFLESLSF